MKRISLIALWFIYTPLLFGPGGKDYYEILGLNKNDSNKKIEDRFQAIRKKGGITPDQQLAYDTLSHPEARRIYDRSLDPVSRETWLESRVLEMMGKYRLQTAHKEWFANFRRAAEQEREIALDLGEKNARTQPRRITLSNEVSLQVTEPENYQILRKIALHGWEVFKKQDISQEDLDLLRRVIGDSLALNEYNTMTIHPEDSLKLRTAFFEILDKERNLPEINEARFIELLDIYHRKADRFPTDSIPLTEKWLEDYSARFNKSPTKLIEKYCEAASRQDQRASRLRFLLPFLPAPLGFSLLKKEVELYAKSPELTKENRLSRLSFFYERTIADLYARADDPLRSEMEKYASQHQSLLSFLNREGRCLRDTGRLFANAMTNPLKGTR